MHYIRVPSDYHYMCAYHNFGHFEATTAAVCVSVEFVFIAAPCQVCVKIALRRTSSEIGFGSSPYVDVLRSRERCSE